MFACQLTFSAPELRMVGNREGWRMKIFLPAGKFANYEKALVSLGAEVERISPEGCSGLLLPGGGDVDPARYGQKNLGSMNIDPERDRREWALLDRFLPLRLPVLGICRGCQVLNVYLGGTLRQDIEGHKRLEDGSDRLHASRTDDPMLKALYGPRFVVNSAHHQAVDRPGDGLRAVQWAEDGTVEALRHERLPVLAVQWHPERLRTPTDGWRLLARWLEEAADR